MKKLSQLLFLVLVPFIGCDDEKEFSPASATLEETEAWPGQSIRIDFENRESKQYPVIFGTTTVVPGSFGRTGLRVTVPDVPAGPITIKMSVPNGDLVLKENFIIRAKPQIIYAAPVTFSHRLPLKIVMDNRDYFSNVNEARFCKGSDCSYGATITENGDTLIIKTSLSYSDYKLQLTGALSFQTESGGPEELKKITSTQEFKYRPSYKLMKTSGKAGEYFDVVFNDTNYFPDQLTVTLKSSAGTETQAVNTGWDIVGSAEYVNATFGRFDIPAVPTGEYTIEVKDEDGIVYLYEVTNVFTVTQ